MVLVVVFFAFIAAVVFAGRVTVGSAHVEAAAWSAARTMSIARDPVVARAEAEADARRTARVGSAMCRSMTFEPVVQRSTDPATVEVEVACVVDLSEALLVKVPGSLTVRASAVEVIDRHREGEP
ncbi:MAG: hypothetical protein ACLFXM_11865 [Acidimicrobiia bacterium]